MERPAIGRIIYVHIEGAEEREVVLKEKKKSDVHLTGKLKQNQSVQLKKAVHKTYLAINTFKKQNYWYVEFRKVVQGTKKIQEKMLISVCTTLFPGSIINNYWKKYLCPLEVMIGKLV